MKVIYSCGDVNGIGLEIFFKSISSFPLLEHILVCNKDSLEEYYEKIHKYKIQENENKYTLLDGSVFTLEKVKHYAKIEFGNITKESGKLSASSIKKSLKLVKKEENSIFVTLPINKASIALSGWKFQGHTEMIADELDVEDYNMLLIAGENRLAPLTIHEPLKKVSKLIKKKLIKNRARSLFKTLKRDFNIETPKIAILGLNPHAGDKGRIGFEEISTIEPAIEELSEEMNLEGPFAADSFFAFSHHKNFDGIISMYHDQGLIPIKMLSNGGGVNYTSGLPIVRVSPDHGTAFSIAGKNRSNPGSLIEAIKTGIFIKTNRQNE